MKNESFNFKEFKYLHDFNFPIACIDLCFSESNRKLLAVGIYKPSVKLFDLKSSTMKFERHLICDPVKILSLQEDAEKFVILREDKAFELHISGGLYETVKIPKQAHELVLNSARAELYMGGSYKEIYRFNLEQGRFLKSIACEGATSMCFSNSNGLICTAYEGNATFYDSRSRNKIFTTKTSSEILCNSISLSGLEYCLGTINGDCIEYDFRSSRPQRIIKGLNPVKKIRYHGKNIFIGATDTLYALARTSDLPEKIFSDFKINSFDFDGGIIFVGGENTDLKGFYSENFGILPSWFNDIVN